MVSKGCSTTTSCRLYWETIDVSISTSAINVQCYLGGGFGGKESRSTFLSSAVAVAAHKLVKLNVNNS